MVDVNTQNKTISVNVSSSGVSSNVSASGDTTLYYSNKAREWAISDKLVSNEDYSSKYYAGKSNQSALNAQSFAQSAQDSYNNVQNSAVKALEDIKTDKTSAISDINSTKSTALTDINTAKNNAVNTVNATASNLANRDLSNLSTIGQAKIDEKVSKSGDTMTGKLIIQTGNTGRNLSVKIPVDLTVRPESNKFFQIGFVDENDRRFGDLEGASLPSGNKIGMVVRNNNNTAYGGLYVGFDENNKVYTQCVTPSTGDNSTNIATTAWVYNMDNTISGWGMPSSKYTDLSLGANNSKYTAPANGWFYLRKKIGTVDNAVCDLNGNRMALSLNPNNNNDGVCAGFLPVLKNDTVTVAYNINGTTEVFRFIYAEGAK